MFRVPYSMAYIYMPPLLKNLLLILMLIVVFVLKLDIPHLVTMCFFVTISSPGLWSVNTVFLIPMQRLNSQVFPMLFLNLVGFAISYQSFIFLYLKILWYIAIMLVSFIYLVILCNINIQNILRWIFTSFRKRQHAVSHEFFMYLPTTRLLSFSPKTYLRFLLLFLNQSKCL